MKTDKLLDALNELIIELQNNKKQQSADFFLLRHNNIQTLNNHMESIKELSTCRAMAQYGNFSAVEENNLDRVVHYAIAILNEKKI
ncbi:hypothetical protein M975_0074 [Buttiauxella brennerae ATCC 51605]|uniref:Uncharacterized protein n=1 Tax=Buttiauxella brennerae ATCC 51605 TaxID=1354251 RepID=A0A1B7IXC0_9ENTR|nr:hypothetical protein [Buttiauxella brennerae]OAT34696.1 hypothetical protein M975_0074 [Buttiauxella brennerae ATCC 51605]